jgi:glutathione S-transferase
LLEGEAGRQLVPSPFEGPIWAYADFCEGLLEDTLFRIASPLLANKKASAHERALFVYVKERKFGAGCVERWSADRDALLSAGRKLLLPTLRTLGRQPFIFGNNPTLADAALYGNLVMLECSEPALLTQLGAAFVDFKSRMDERCRAVSKQRPTLAPPL